MVYHKKQFLDHSMFLLCHRNYIAPHTINAVETMGRFSGIGIPGFDGYTLRGVSSIRNFTVTLLNCSV